MNDREDNRTKRNMVVIGESIVVTESRWCACGCGEKLPENASKRREFIDTTHRSRAHRKGRKTLEEGVQTRSRNMRTALAKHQIIKLGEEATTGNPEALDDLKELEGALDETAVKLKHLLGLDKPKQKKKQRGES